MTLKTLFDQITESDIPLLHELNDLYKFDMLDRGPYDLVESSKSKLLVTIGDSWTYGARLSEEFNDLPESRVENCFGAQIAKDLQADLVNLSIPGSNNLWMARHYADVCRIAEKIDYDEIFVFVTLTEFGREISSQFDLDPVLNDKYRRAQGARDMAVALAEYTADIFLSNQHPKVKLALGVNYVNNIYPSRLQKYFVKNSWLECLLNRPFDQEALAIMSWVIEKFKLLPKEFNANIDHAKFTTECLEWIEQAHNRINLIYNTGYNYKVGYGHPNSQGHKIWAEYIKHQGIFG